MSTKSTSKFMEPQKLSQMIKSKTLNNLDLVHEAKQDIKASIFHDSKNSLDFYDINMNVTLPKKLIPKNFPQTYKSIHRLVECKAAKRLVSVFQEKVPNHLEKEALKEIQKEDKYNYLPNLYLFFFFSNVLTCKGTKNSQKMILPQGLNFLNQLKQFLQKQKEWRKRKLKSSMIGLKKKFME